jgi:very-short-patch-repair endonuclease
MKIYYNPKLKQKARELSKNSTLSEILLWNNLKGRQIYGYQFMRQKPIGDYIVDFFCSKLKLIIEIDGISHLDKEKYDNERQERLESMGLFFLRFSDIEVKKNMQGVLRAIEDFIKSKRGQPPTPFLRGNNLVRI